MTFSLWTDADRSCYTLHEGLEQPTFVNGTADPTATRLVHSFEASSWTEAVRIFTKHLKEQTV